MTTPPELQHLHSRIATTLVEAGEILRRGAWYQRWTCPACRTITLTPIPLEDP